MRSRAIAPTARWCAWRFRSPTASTRRPRSSRWRASPPRPCRSWRVTCRTERAPRSGAVSAGERRAEFQIAVHAEDDLGVQHGELVVIQGAKIFSKMRASGTNVLEVRTGTDPVQPPQTQLLGDAQ